MQCEIYGLAFLRFAQPQLLHPVPILLGLHCDSITTMELMLYTGRMSLVSVWPTTQVLFMRVSHQLSVLNCKKEPGLL